MPDDTDLLRATAARAGSGDSIGVDPENDPERGTRLFMIDFEGETVPEPDSPVEAVVDVSGGKLSSVTSEYNEPLHAWRVYVRVRPGESPDVPVEIRCFLKLGEDTLSETWLYRWGA